MSEVNYLDEWECDSSVKTIVKLGRSKNIPAGWALNLNDIQEFIPVKDYEQSCWVLINDVIAPCYIRINPRLFYKSNILKGHLKYLKETKPDKNIPLEVKFNKEDIYKHHQIFDNNYLDYIDTKLLVGKSYKSRGWALSKEAVSKLFPLKAYNCLFPVIVDDILVNAKINIQTRLFYSRGTLENLLFDLHEKGPKRKVDAKIILNEKFLKEIKKIQSSKYKKTACVICGNKLEMDYSGNKCFDCLNKEFAVPILKKLLDYIKPNSTFSEEVLLDCGYSKRQIVMDINKLIKYNLVVNNFDGSFKLVDKSVLNDFLKKWGD